MKTPTTTPQKKTPAGTIRIVPRMGELPPASSKVDRRIKNGMYVALREALSKLEVGDGLETDYHSSVQSCAHAAAHALRIKIKTRKTVGSRESLRILRTL